jgi:hypothetical protein
MRMRFWRESSARPGENLCDTVVANFLLLIGDRYRARFTPKPGHIALSPCRSGGLFAFVALIENQVRGLSWQAISSVAVAVPNLAAMLVCQDWPELWRTRSSSWDLRNIGSAKQHTRPV